MSRRRLRNPCWEAECYLREAQEVISQSYHELKSLGLADSSDSNNEIGNWLSRSVPQSGIRRRKSAVELSSHRYPSGIVYDEQNKLRRNGANTTISLFAINVFEENPVPRRKRFTHRQKRNAFRHNSNSRERFSTSTCTLHRLCSTSSTSSSERDQSNTHSRPHLYKKLARSHHESDSDESACSASDTSQNERIFHRPTERVLGAANASQRTFISRGPAARRAHRRAATARMSSVAERFQPIQSASQTRFMNANEKNEINVRRALSVRNLNGTMVDFSEQHSVIRWTSQILAEINSLPSSRFDLNELAIVQPTNAKVDCNDDISSVLSVDSIKPVQLSSQMIAAGPLESEGNVHATRRVDAIGEEMFYKSDQRSLGAQDCVRTASLSTRTLSASSVEESEQNVTETVEHRASSSNHGIECTSSFEIIAEPSSRNVQKESTVVVTVSPKTTPISPRKLPSSLSRLCSLLPGRRSKHERVSRNGDEATTAHYNSLLNYATKGSSILHCTMAKMRTESRQSDSIIHLSKTIYDNDLFSDQGSANLDKTVRLYKRPTMNSNGEDTQMRNVLSSSCFKQWRSLDNCRPGSSTRQSHENETTLALKKWKHKAERRSATTVGMSEDRGATQEVENRRSVHGVVASLIRAAEIRRFESVDRSPPASGQPKSSTALLEASTQTSPLCLSRSSSFDWVNEPSDPIDFEATVFPEQITTVLQPEPGPSAVEPDGTQKGYFVRRSHRASRTSTSDARAVVSRASHDECFEQIIDGKVKEVAGSGEKLRRQMIHERKTAASQDIDESIAMLLEYADDLTSSSSVRTGHKFLSEKELNAIDGFGKMAQADDSSSSAKCASPSVLACNVQLDTRLADSTANGNECHGSSKPNDDDIQWRNGSATTASFLTKSIYDNVRYLRIDAHTDNETKESTRPSISLGSSIAPNKLSSNGHVKSGVAKLVTSDTSSSTPTPTAEHCVAFTPNLERRTPITSPIKTGVHTGCDRVYCSKGCDSSACDTSSSPLRLTECTDAKSTKENLISPEPCTFGTRLPNRAGSCEELCTQRTNQEDEKSFAQKKRLAVAEEEAIESCRWLRDAGFPQYVRLYEERRFPIDIRLVKHDHEFLDADSLKALFRRLNTLNRCAIMETENVILRKNSCQYSVSLLDSDPQSKIAANNYDEDDQVAISNRWKYQRKSHTWSRIVDGTVRKVLEEDVGRAESETSVYGALNEAKRLSENEERSATKQSIAVSPTHKHCISSEPALCGKSPCVQRSQSERLRERARAFMKRVDVRWSARHRRRVREGVSCERNGTKEPVIGQPVLISHYSASPRPMRMLPDGVTKSAFSSIDPSALDSDRCCKQSDHHDSVVNTRRMGMVLLSPATDSSSGDDCLRSHDESNLSRLASFEPCMTEGTINYGPYSSSLVDRKIYDRVAATPDAVPKHATSPYMMHRLWYYSPPSCSSPEMSCASDGTRNTKTANIASLQRNATRTVAHRDSTPPNSRLSSARTSARGEGETSHTDLTSDTVYGMQPQPLSALYTLSDRCRLIVNADGYYEHIPDLGSNSPEVAVGLQTGSNIEHPSMCSLQRSTSPASSSSTTSSSYNFTRLKGSVSLQKERTRACGSDWGGRIGSRERCSHTSSLKIGVYEHEAVRDGVMVPQRRDSGVGSSLSRSPSGPTTQRQVWSFLVRPAVNNSKTRCEATAASSDLLSGERADLDGTFIDDADLSHCIDALSVTEILRLRKLAFLRLSVLLERYGGSGMRVDTVTANTNNSNLRNWTVQKLLKRMRASDVKSTNGESSVFGMPLSVVHSRSGLSLPRGILEVMHFLSTHVADTVGIFRKNGVRSRIAELRTKCDVHPDQEVFPHSKGLDPLQVHDMADMLKQYFRELPDPLMTAKYSQLFANIFLYLPNDLRLNALQYAILLLPDENREALQTLLFFLRDIAVRSATNNMTAQNLAVCLAPSLFHLSTSRLNRVSPARRHKTIGTSGMPTEREMKESRAAQECLAHMIHYCLKLFVRPLGHDFEVPSSGGFNEPEMPFLTDLGISDGGNYKTCLLQKAKELIKEHNDRWKGWIVEGVVDGVEISSKKPLDGHPLRYFRAWADVEAPPKQLLMRLIRQRNIWDPYTINWRNVASLNDEDCDVFQYVLNDTPAHPTRDVLVVRLWRTNVKELRGGCVLVERSVRSSETQLLGGVPAVVLASRFLIEPCSGRSRVTYISRIDLRGRSNVWYGKVYGGMIARQISLLRDSFRRVDHKNDGPESNV